MSGLGTTGIATPQDPVASCGAPHWLWLSWWGFFVAGFGVLWRVLGMPEYEYEALDSSDNSVAGKIESSSANDALKSLISDGLRVTQISGLNDEEDLDVDLLTVTYVADECDCCAGDAE